MTEEDFEQTCQLLRRKGFELGKSSYHRESFGSWYISVIQQPTMRIVWDGKDGWVIIQHETGEQLQGLMVWKDMWVGRKRHEQTVDFIVSMIQGLIANESD